MTRTPPYNVGDLIRMTRGEEILQGRVVNEYTVRTGKEVYATLDPTTALSADALAYLGFTLEVIEEAEPPLPTAPGVYRDNDGDFWALNDEGNWRFLSEASRSDAFVGTTDPESYVPLTLVQ